MMTSDDGERDQQRGDQIARVLARAVGARGLGLAGGGLVGRLGPAELGDDPRGSAPSARLRPPRGGLRALRRGARRLEPALGARAATPRSVAASASPRSHSASDCSSVGVPCSSSATTRTSSSRACSNESDATSGRSSLAGHAFHPNSAASGPWRWPTSSDRSPDDAALASLSAISPSERARERSAPDRDDHAGCRRRLRGIPHDHAVGQVGDRVAARERRGGRERAQRSRAARPSRVRCVSSRRSIDARVRGRRCSHRCCERDVDHRLGGAQRRGASAAARAARCRAAPAG